MQLNSSISGLNDITYLAGNESTLADMPNIPVQEPFNSRIINFLNLVSKKLFEDQKSKLYPDVVTLAFWLRKSSVENLKKRFQLEDNHVYRTGRGVAFHIAPSNVPVNYAYSLFTGLLTGNANVVRVPSKDFIQVEMINCAIADALDEMPEMQPYICLIRYGHNPEINDAISSIADIRIVWGGDDTIAELRKSPMKPRASEITFADRFSLSVIDSDEYMEDSNKSKIAGNFYNDTFLTDQNACTSPRLVIWTGSSIEKAKADFWNELHILAEKKYQYKPVQGVNKLTSAYRIAACKENIMKEKSMDNLIVRIAVGSLDEDLMDYKDNSGYFFEYSCRDISELEALCNDTRCQTISYIGNPEMFLPLVKKGVKGVDRIVPIGKTMDYDFFWDGYNLYERMTRLISIL